MTEPIGDVFCKGSVILGSGCLRCGRCAVGLAEQQASAVATLKRLGYTDCGGELWKPPLGLLHKPRRGMFDASRKIMDESGVVRMQPSADLPEPAWRAETIRTTEDAYSAEQMRQQFDAGRTFQADRDAPAAAAAPSDHQCKLLADALGECIMAAGIVRKDIDGLSGPQLLMFAEDLKRHLAAPTQEQVTQRAGMNEAGYLPCPFCGSEDVSLSVGETGDGTPWHYVECGQCAGTSEPDRWNDRPAPAQAQEDAARYRILRDNPRIAHRFAGLHAWQRDQYVDAARAAKKGGAA